jgi:hypothetical protein
MQSHFAAQAPLGVIPSFSRPFQPPMDLTSTLLLSFAELLNQAHISPLEIWQRLLLGCKATHRGNCWPAAPASSFGEQPFCRSLLCSGA